MSKNNPNFRQNTTSSSKVIPFFTVSDNPYQNGDFFEIVQVLEQFIRSTYPAGRRRSRFVRRLIIRIVDILSPSSMTLKSILYFQNASQGVTKTAWVATNDRNGNVCNIIKYEIINK